MVERGDVSNVLRLSGSPVVDVADATFEEMLGGWRNQMLARNLAFATIAQRHRLVRRFADEIGDYPWEWTPAMFDEWLGDLRAVKGLARSTIRAHGLGVRMFCDYLVDPGYGWQELCEARFETFPVQISHQWNTAVHVQEAEAEASVRPFRPDELQDFFDCADNRVARTRQLGRKGWVAGFRDATLFKCAYAWGLRRNEVRMLDVTDFGANPRSPEFGTKGVLYVRHGKAMSGSAPKPRSVLTVFGWAIDCLEEWMHEVRADVARVGDGCLWPTERGRRVSPGRLGQHFRDIRAEVGLPDTITFHSFRRAYVTHLIEDGFDAKFVQDQVGHEHASTTALYTGVSSDYRTRVLRDALDRVSGALDLNTGTNTAEETR